MIRIRPGGLLRLQAFVLLCGLVGLATWSIGTAQGRGQVPSLLVQPPPSVSPSAVFIGQALTGMLGAVCVGLASVAAFDVLVGLRRGREVDPRKVAFCVLFVSVVVLGLVARSLFEPLENDARELLGSMTGGPLAANDIVMVTLEIVSSVTGGVAAGAAAVVVPGWRSNPAGGTARLGAFELGFALGFLLHGWADAPNMPPQSGTLDGLVALSAAAVMVYLHLWERWRREAGGARAGDLAS
jgi:hypothetical protein